MCHYAFCLSVLVTLLAGCAPAPRPAEPFVLTDDSAQVRLMATQTVKQKAATCSVPLVCGVDFQRPGEVDLYLGEDHDDHMSRIGNYRVTTDGRVWVNTDPTALEDAWAVVP